MFEELGLAQLGIVLRVVDALVLLGPQELAHRGFDGIIDTYVLRVAQHRLSGIRQFLQVYQECLVLLSLYDRTQGGVRSTFDDRTIMVMRNGLFFIIHLLALRLAHGFGNHVHQRRKSGVRSLPLNLDPNASIRGDEIQPEELWRWSLFEDGLQA
ncbi:MAG: hypothetical protein V3V98_07440 [Thermoplasmata archaeon]